MPDAHAAAVEAMAAALRDCRAPRIVSYHAQATAALAALVRSEAVRAALVEALIVAVCVHSDGRPFCIDCDIDAILAALAPEAT